MKLVLSERKSVNTLTYLICIVMAYYGPNAEILGNIKLSIWQFDRPIADIEAYISKVSILLAVDLLSLVVSGIILRMICGINVLKTLRKLQKQYWQFFAIAEGYLLMEVSKPL